MHRSTTRGRVPTQSTGGPKLLEADLEKQLVKWAREQGGWSLKLKIENERGFTDQTILLPGARIAFPELKHPKRSSRSFNQEKWVRRLTEMGFKAGFCKTFDEVMSLLED